MVTIQSIQSVLDSTFEKIAKAAGDRDSQALEDLMRKLRELSEMKRTAIEIEERLRHLSAPSPEQDERTEKSNYRELPIKVTRGMLNQSFLTLTHHVQRGDIRPGEVLDIEAQPSGERFDAEVLPNGNKLNKRGPIGHFYKAAEVRAGDFVVLTEFAQGRWILRKALNGQYRDQA